MHTPRDNQIIAKCLTALSKSEKPRSKVAYGVLDWVDDELGDCEFDGSYHCFPGAASNKKHVRKDWPKAKKRLKDFVSTTTETSHDFVDNNAEILAEAANLETAEKSVLNILLRMATNRQFDSFCDNLISDFGLTPIQAMAQLTDLSEDVLSEILSPMSNLMLSGIVVFNDRFRSEYWFSLAPSLHFVFARPLANAEEVLGILAEKACPPETNLDDFSHVETDISIARRLLVNAISNQNSGVNFLIYGPPGTGKTELSKALAKDMGATLYQIAEKSAHDEPSRKDRLNALGLCQRLMSGSTDKLFLFDEMEDIDDGPSLFGGRSQSSKVFMNRMLENNAVPVIWVSNSLAPFDKAFLRRFTFSMKMDVPPIEVRRNIWGRIYDKHQPDVPKPLILRLAEDINLPPAHVDTAFRTVKIIEGDSIDLARVFRNQSKLCGTPLKKPNQGHPFNPQLVQSETNIIHLTERLLNANTQAFSLCISGLPGTGKSAYGRYLAGQIGLPILQKRASDLLDKYVGGSEKQIARAFEEAMDTGSVLMFDEADSLLSNREKAARNWEVSQVNELLTHMEDHALPFIATTNLAKRLDPASLRRFTFKLELLPLTLLGLKRAYKHYFDAKAPPSILTLTTLTAGDFHVVKKRCDILGVQDSKDIAFELVAESEAKNLASKPIGFKLHSLSP